LLLTKNNEFAKVKVELVSSNETSTEELPYLALTSTYGGTIASREILGKKQVQRPENALYQLNFSSSESPKDLQWQTAGSVKIDSENYNIFQNIFNATTSLLIQESGF